MRVLKVSGGPLDETYPAPRDITIEDLLTHRSGLRVFLFSEGPAFRRLSKGVRKPDFYRVDGRSNSENARVLPAVERPRRTMALQPRDRRPRRHCRKDQFRPLHDVMRAKLFDPLGMVDTDFFIPPEKRDRAAGLYFFDGRSAAPVRMAIADDAMPNFCSGGGGLVSTADDFLKFACMLLGRGQVDGVRLLKEETVSLMTRDRLSNEQRATLVREELHWSGQGFGLGLGIDIDAEERLNSPQPAWAPMVGQAPSAPGFA